MSMNGNYYTIIAQATPIGKSGVGILRISGNRAREVAIQVLGHIPKPRFAFYSNFLDIKGNIIDKGIVLWFPKPNSFTGEDVLELQGHGNPIILDLLIKNILLIEGVRIARPGEFSERAFLNGKIDLIQAEAISDLISASSEEAIKSSFKSLQGDFSNKINYLIDSLSKIRVKLEALINFLEFDIDDDFCCLIEKNLIQLITYILEIEALSKQGSILREGKKFVISGKTNAGKSSLLNALSCQNNAIVTDIEGTTRDLLHQNINIDGILVHLVDTAGLRKTNDKIEKLGIQRAWSEIYSADHILYVIDSTMHEEQRRYMISQFIKSIPNNISITVILNKIDLVKEQYNNVTCINNVYYIGISAKFGTGIKLLRQHLKHMIGFYENITGVFYARRRHLNALKIAKNKIIEGKENWILYKNIEMLADCLSSVEECLFHITGRKTSEDLLEKIFSEFCIGK